MKGRRSVLVISTLCAVVLAGLAAGNASAEQRAFTCAAGGTEFSDAHCVTAGSGFGHVSIANGTATEIVGTNAKTASGTTAAQTAIVKGTTPFGVTEIQCTGLALSGELTNAASSVSGAGTITFSGCSVVQPGGQNCVVKGGSITTAELAVTTVSQPAGSVKVSPGTGTQIAPVTVEKCMNPALNNTFSMTGSFVATASGATLTTTHAGITTQNTLKLAGAKFGLESVVTLSRKEGSPIAFT